MLLPILLTSLTLPPQDGPDSWRDRRPSRPAVRWDGLEGQPAPPLDGLTGWHNTPALSWEDLRGHVVLLQSFDEDHRTAERDLTPLVELFLELRDEGLVLFSVHGPEEADEFEGYVLRRGLPHVVAVDPEGEFLGRIRGRRKPTYHLVDRGGNIRIAGLVADPEVLEEAARAVLAEPWEGERDEIAYAVRFFGHARPDAPPPVELGPDGWPVHADKHLGARVDLRGRPSPGFGATHWITAEVDVTGRPHLLLLWRTDTAFVHELLDGAQALHERFGPRLVVLAISDQAPDRWKRSQARPYGDLVAGYLEQHPEWTFAQALDGNEVLEEAAGIVGEPHALLVDSAGIVRWQGDPLADEDPLGEPLVERFLVIDALVNRTGRLSVEEGGLLLVGAPPETPGSWWALPPGAARVAARPGDRLAVPSEHEPWPLGASGPTDPRGRLEGPRSLPAGLGSGALAWRPRRPAGYPGPLPLARGD